MQEIELKFLLDEASAKALRARIRNSPLRAGEPSTRLLRTSYFDTPGHVLRKAGVALRLRRVGRRWLQTVKAGARLHGGLSQVAELESPARGGRVALDLIPDVSLKDEIARLVGGEPLEVVCETVLRRTSVLLSVAPGQVAELAVDSGEVRAGDRSLPLHEAEIELVEGPVGTLFDLALALFPEGGLDFSRLPKSARGYLLAEKGFIEPPPAPRLARCVPLETEQTVEEAAQVVLRECADQIAANVTVLRVLDDPEGPHQLRVGLRRLRSALTVFGVALASPALDTIAGEARWAGAEVGRLRDLDVAMLDLVGREAEINAGEAGLTSLAQGLEARADVLRKDLRNLVLGRRMQAFLLELVRFIETRGWLVADDIAQTARLAMPIGSFAETALRKRWKKVARQAEHLDTMRGEDRHELRKDLKKLRYAVEFLAPLYTEKKVRPFLKRLKGLQEIFGAANDAEMLQTLLDASDEWRQDISLQRAMGWAIGASRARAELGWEKVEPAWRELKAARPFWR